jgi:type VI secretion system protein ImpM
MLSPTGLYGKLPCAGDFVTRSLPATFVMHWDDWLQRCLLASRTKLGGRWTEVYLHSPLWRFALQPQVCGPQAWAGVLMPSVDRAGRYFPLTLAAPVPTGASALLSVTAAEHWYAQLEGIALWSLQPEATLEEIESQLVRLPLAGVPAEADARDDWDFAVQLGRWWSKPGRSLELTMPIKQTLPAVAEFAAAYLMEEQSHGQTLWWTRDEVAQAISFRGWQGLPPPVQYADCLDATTAGAQG